MKIATLAILFAILAVDLPLLLAQEHHFAGRQILKRAGEPDYVDVADNDKRMDQAVQKARKTVGRFIDSLRSPGPGQSRFAVKRPYVQNGRVEHLWLRNVTYDGKAFHGVVDNKPDVIKGVSLGDKASAAPGEISDWMYVQNGKLVGGYTVRALCHDFSPGEKRQFCARAGFEFADM